MKIKHLLTISIMIILIIPQLSCQKEWAATIDNKKISMDEFNRVYYFQAKNILNIDSDEEVDKLIEKEPGLLEDRRFGPILDKNKFIKSWIGQKLLYEKAMNDKTIDKDEFKTYLELTKMQSVNQYFLQKKFKDRVAPSNEDIEKFYRERKAQFAGMNPDDVTNYIRQQLSLKNFGNESARYIENLMAEHVINYDGLKEFQKKPSETTPSENK